MKILHIALESSTEDGRDNITYPFIVKEMEGLAAMGHDVVFFCWKPAHDVGVRNGVQYEGADEMKSVTRLDVALEFFANLRLFFIPLLTNPRRTYWIMKKLAAISKVCKTQEIELIHSHFMAPAGTSAVPVARRLKLPVVSTIRGAELYGNAELEYGSMLDPIFRRFARYASGRVDQFTVPNKGMMDLILTNWSKPKRAIRYLPNGFLPPPQGTKHENNGKLRFVAVGRLLKRKNYLTMLEAFARVPNSLAELTIIGIGPDETIIKDKIRDLSLTNVILAPEVSNQEVFEIMRQADALVHTSFIEGLPNVVLESLAVGTPVILSNIIAHEDLVQEGETGFYFDPQNATDLAEILLSICSNPKLVRDKQEICKESVKQFTLSRKLMAYQEIYDGLLREQHG